jgi:hypothetical protein
MGATKEVITVGETYGPWLVLEYVGQDPRTHKRIYRCLCLICNVTISEIRASKLKAGTSGGCMSCSRTTHGLSRTVEYRVCQNAIRRCTDPRDPHYPHYGGDPVKPVWVQEDWYTPENLGVGSARMTAYVLRTIGPRPSPEHQLDRIDNTGGYTEGNLRWVLPHVNSRNRRDNRIIEWAGKSQTLIEWSEELGIPRDTLAWRLDHGWSIDRAMTTPVRPLRRSSPSPTEEAA